MIASFRRLISGGSISQKKRLIYPLRWPYGVSGSVVFILRRGFLCQTTTNGFDIYIPTIIIPSLFLSASWFRNGRLLTAIVNRRQCGFFGIGGGGRWPVGSGRAIEKVWTPQWRRPAVRNAIVHRYLVMSYHHRCKVECSKTLELLLGLLLPTASKR